MDTVPQSLNPPPLPRGDVEGVEPVAALALVMSSTLLALVTVSETLLVLLKMSGTLYWNISSCLTFYSWFSELTGIDSGLVGYVAGINQRLSFALRL